VARLGLPSSLPNSAALKYAWPPVRTVARAGFGGWTMSDAYGKLQRLLREAASLYSVASLLSWDQETMMPPRGAQARAESLGLITKLAHERATDPRLEEHLAACEANPALTNDERVSANLREVRRDYDLARKLPGELVAEMKKTSALAIEAWKSARRDSEFASFRPWLEKQVALNRSKAECYGAPEGGELYDALVDEFEPGMTGAELERIFGPLRDELSPLIAAVTAAPYQPSLAPQRVELSLERQRELNLEILERVGFDLDGGRLDVSVHPFASGIAPHDTRITTRYRKDQFAEALSSTLHEAGHALYEQGLPKEEYWGQPLAQPLGLGIHESQSRLWENHVGRSRALWDWAFPLAKQAFRPALDGFDVDDLYHAVNVVRPNLIRVESDEATYNLHVMLRFDLERALIREDLSVADLPAAWNARILDDLGLEVPDDARGCLQDIHWAIGAIGYFPTYTLGSLYAAQFWEAIVEALPELEQQISCGEFAALRSWLRENIHSRGRWLPASELCLRLTHGPLDHRALMRHLNGKLRAIYRLEHGP
jgi:carboxypeptidase Taq